MIEALAVAIYNADLKRLEYITNSVAEATRIIVGGTNVNTDEKIRYALRNKKKIENNLLGYNVAIRVATNKQVDILGKKKFLKIKHSEEI